MSGLDKPVASPATFVPQSALAFADAGGNAVQVSGTAPLPIAPVTAAASSAPLAGTASASGSAGPFVPQLGRAIRVTLSGGWTGNVQLLRSVDAGVTRLPITVGGQAWGSFTANANEVVTEESEAGATYYLAITLATGTLTYRVAQ